MNLDEITTRVAKQKTSATIAEKDTAAIKKLLPKLNNLMDQIEDVSAQIEDVVSSFNMPKVKMALFKALQAGADLQYGFRSGPAKSVLSQRLK